MNVATSRFTMAALSTVLVCGGLCVWPTVVIARQYVVASTGDPGDGFEFEVDGGKNSEPTDGEGGDPTDGNGISAAGQMRIVEGRESGTMGDPGDGDEVLQGLSVTSCTQLYWLGLVWILGTWRAASR